MGDSRGRPPGRQDVDAQRIVHHRPRQLFDRGRHRRGEHHRAPLLWNLADDLAHLREKSEVEHVVGFIEDELLDGIDANRPPLDVIEQTSGCCDDDVGFPFDRRHLPLHLHAADQTCGFELMRLSEELDEGLRLQRDLASGGDDERAQSAAVLQFLCERNDEGRRFSRAGLRERDDVAATQRGRNHRGLDRRRVLESDFANAFEDGFAEAELVKRFDRRGYGMMRDAVVVHVWWPVSNILNSTKWPVLVTPISHCMAARRRAGFSSGWSFFRARSSSFSSVNSGRKKSCGASPIPTGSRRSAASSASTGTRAG